MRIWGCIFFVKNPHAECPYRILSILGGHSAFKILYGNLRPGVADGYSFSCIHGNLHLWYFPAARNGESANTVVIDGDMLGGNTVLLFSVVI